MGYTDLAHLTHLMENVLDAIRNGEMPVTSDWLMGSSEDVMHNLKVCRIFFQQQQLFVTCL
jgi:chemotaxis protein histidine kinase CheA